MEPEPYGTTDCPFVKIGATVSTGSHKRLASMSSSSFASSASSSAPATATATAPLNASNTLKRQRVEDITAAGGGKYFFGNMVKYFVQFFSLI